MLKPPPDPDVERSHEERREVQLAPHGAGPLLQRDYVIVLEGAACSPEEMVRKVRSDFPRFPPEVYCIFDRPEGAEGPLQVGDTMHVYLRGAGHAGVLVTHVDARSMTLRTQQGHQEAGRITFGASYDVGGRVVFRIRSRARQGNVLRYLGYAFAGKFIQKRIWAYFLERLARECGGRMLGGVVSSTDRVSDSPADQGAEEAPTLVAKHPQGGDGSTDVPGGSADGERGRRGRGGGAAHHR